MTRHCDVYLIPPQPRGWNSTVGLVPEGHRILVYDQELEKEVDLDTFNFSRGVNSEKAFAYTSSLSVNHALLSLD